MLAAGCGPEQPILPPHPGQLSLRGASPADPRAPCSVSAPEPASAVSRLGRDAFEKRQRGRAVFVGNSKGAGVRRGVIADERLGRLRTDATAQRDQLPAEIGPAGAL